MFDDVLRELARMKTGITIQVPIQLDDDSYFDRICPAVDCAGTFKVLLADWKSKVSDDRAFCAFCRHEAAASEFNTPEQQAYFIAAAQAEVMRRLNRSFQSSTEAFNVRQTRGFITMHMQYNAPAMQLSVPPEAEDAMTLRITCEGCGCQYAVVGAGYFCPACGHNSAETTFDQTLGRARHAVDSLPAVKAAVTDKDIAAQLTQSLIEGTLGSLVTAFQRFTEATYPKLPNPTTTVRRNAFQNLSEGSRLWENAGGHSYATTLGVAEMANLSRLFQQRHVLQHQEGIIDQDYINRSGDTTYAVGQRLVIREQTVLQLASLLEVLVIGMKADQQP